MTAACIPSGTATAGEVRPPRCSSSPVAWPTSRGCPGSTSARSAYFLDGSAGEPRPGHLGRRALSRDPPRHADHPRRCQTGQPPGRGGAPGGRDVVRGGRDPRPRRSWSRPGSSCSSSSSTTSCPVRASSGSTRTRAATTPRFSHIAGRVIGESRRPWPAHGRTFGWRSTPPSTDRTEVVELPDGQLAVVAAPACGWATVAPGRRPGWDAAGRGRRRVDGPTGTSGFAGTATGCSRRSGTSGRPGGAGAGRARATCSSCTRTTRRAFDAWNVDREPLIG